MRLLVLLEQGLDGDEQDTRILIRFHGEVENLIIDGAVHPATDAGIRLRPRGVSRAHILRAIDVTEQPVLGAESGEERLPLGEVGALEAEGDRDVLLHVDGGVSDVEGRSDSVPQRASYLGTNGARDGGRSRRRSQHDDRGLETTALVRRAAWSGDLGGGGLGGARPGLRQPRGAAAWAAAWGGGGLRGARPGGGALVWWLRPRVQRRRKQRRKPRIRALNS